MFKLLMQWFFAQRRQEISIDRLQAMKARAEIMDGGSGNALTKVRISFRRKVAARVQVDNPVASDLNANSVLAQSFPRAQKLL